MSDPQHTQVVAALRDALKEVRRLQGVIRAGTEPVAVVGIGCRFPGEVASPDDLWRLLVSEVDALGPFPRDRGWEVDGVGGFLSDPAGFDPVFFGISPREALAMDPQQRLLLETTWEALERAGIDAESLRGSDTGVFIGTNGQDYAELLRRSPRDADGYLVTGTAASVVSGRIAYTFGFEGPTSTVDTACSSSLVAVHQAVRALRDGECGLAVAGGATVMATPAVFTEFGRQQALAEDGRCKPFAAAADGTGFSEGVGVLVLERLSDARRLGHPVLAVVRGSAVNSDGASNGLTAPNGPSQQRVIRAALASAGLSTSDIDAIEAHGTGTVLGDPIEADALIATYGQDRSSPVWLGSVKSNLGHTQAAAGVAGVIKMVLALRHGVLPRTLHVDEPTPKADWSAGAVRLLTEALEWPAIDRPRRAAVSAFGVSGTNAHVILEQAPVDNSISGPELSDRRDTIGVGTSFPPWGETPLAFSAKSAVALCSSVDAIKAVDADPRDVAATLARRAVFDHRAVLLGDELITGRARPGRVVFVFPGQGAQWAGMATDLMAVPAFARRLTECAEALKPYVELDLTEILRVDVVQPALWAVMVSLAELWRSCGVEPDAVIGHSQGEIAAAVVAGALSLEDGARIVALRSRALTKISGKGGMIAVQRVPDGLPGTVSVAAVNGPGSFVLSGEVEDLDGKLIPVDYASHSAQVEPLRDELLDLLMVTPAASRVPMYSTVENRWLDTARLDADYWYRNLRHTVRFADAVRAVHEQGHGVFLEISPHPVLTYGVEETAPDAAVLHTLHRDHGAPSDFLRALARAHVGGARVDWSRFVTGGRLVDLPTYPFERARFWVDAPPSAGDPAALGLGATGHALLPVSAELPDGLLCTGSLSGRTHPWLMDHEINGTVLVPGTAMLELAAEAGRRVGCGRVEELVLHTPLAVEGTVPIQVVVSAADEHGRRPVTVRSCTTEWITNASGVLAAPLPEPDADIPPHGEPVDVDDLYARLDFAGYRYGPAFRGLRAAWRTATGVIADVRLPEGFGSDGFGVHPALLDAALHAVLPASGQGRMPFAWSGVQIHAPGAAELRVVLVQRETDEVSLVATDPSGRLVLVVDKLVTRPAGRDLHHVSWHPVNGDGLTDYDVDYDVVWCDDTDVRAALSTVLTALRDERERPLVVVTRGAVATTGGEDVPNLAGAAVWGLVRSAQTEHPGRYVLVDADSGSGEIGPLPADEPQLALRGNGFLVPRLTRVPPLPSSWRMGVTTPGTLDNVTVVAAPRAPLAPHEVRIAVRAAGVNFRDVLIALGMYPEPTTTLGSEGAGVVVELGSEVDDLTIGDRVLGLLPGAFGPFAVTERRWLARMPEGWTFEQAAAVPTAFLTAAYALRDLAEVRAGESVLVHAAAGGVGMAAVQLARHWGARVLATASPEKWEVVRGLGVEDVASSRTLEFADLFPRVDVVLNALAGEFVDASLRLVRPGGRFVELGRRDLREVSDVDYHAFELTDAGDRLTALLTEVLGLFERGVLRPLPITTWDVRDARQALRHMSQAKHVGKIVLTVPDDPDRDGTVLVTGGTGVLGRAIARHLVGRGFTDVLLLGRTETSENFGPGIRTAVCDVADRAALADVVARHHVTGVIHAAGVLDDATVDALTGDQLDAVLRPKVDGARNLHELCGDAEMFVLFSSAAGVLGAPGQANYAAANAYLDGLAHHRRAQGLPAVSLAWGLWERRSAMTGALDDADLTRMARHGVAPLSEDECLALFDEALTASAPVLVPARLTGSGDAAVLRPLTSRPVPRSSDVDTLELVRAEAAVVIGHASGAAIDPRATFRSLGFDSLTAVELRNRLSAATGLRLPPTLVFDHPTPLALSDFLRAAPTRAEVARPVPTGDPVVIVGMSCRYPGDVTSPDDLWRLLVEAREVAPAPVTGRGWTQQPLGRFLDRAGEFDAAFFGISPHEATAMDPQQRLLLELSWEALERAGIDPHSLRGTPTGVFVGLADQHYVPARVDEPAELEGFLLTGNTSSVASGRVAYAFGFEGPVLTVDTACSSSLVALHLAVSALRSGECSLALAGGVSVMPTPHLFGEFARQGVLASDGRCKAFSASADGAGFAEGAGVLVVERLSDARRLGHEVLAVVRGSAVNSDGASNGLTAPNGPSQQRVIRAALSAAGVSTSDVDVVEAHGTGTRLGDPIEASALLATYGQDRPDALLLGSIKSNIGHTQAAAGVAGVIKMVLAMRHGVVPASLHVSEPSPHVEWSAGAVELVTSARSWPSKGRPRRAAVSSFGISGTNAHVILESSGTGIPPFSSVSSSDKDSGAAGEAVDNSAPVDNSPVVDLRGVELSVSRATIGVGTSLPPWGETPFVVSAKSEFALRAQARRLLQVEARPLDLGYSLATTRAALDHRAVVLGRDRDELTAGLRDLAEGTPSAAVVTGTAALRRTAFVFPGQGAQWAGMAEDLMTFPAFADCLRECEEALRPHVELDLRDTHRVEVAQPALWAVMVSLARLWRSFGVEPEAVVGHSQGEIAAAVVSGALSLDDGAKIVALRSRMLARLAGRGAMLTVVLPPGDVEPLLGADLAIAAVNGPSTVVVSGDVDALNRLQKMLGDRGVTWWMVPGSVASHSAQIDDLRDELLTALRDITPRRADIPFCSGLTGDFVDKLDARYWFDSLRGTVRFADATTALRRRGFDAFVEVSPHPVLIGPLHDSGAVVVETLRREDSGPSRMLKSLAQAHVHGLPVDFAQVLTGGRRVELPTYPFERTHYWIRGADPGAFDDAGITRLAERLGVERERIVAALRQESVVDGWRHVLTWVPVSPASRARGRWVVVAPAGHRLSAAVVAALRDAGAQVRLVEAGTGRPEFTAIAEADAVVSLLSTMEERVGAVPLGLAMTLDLLQAVAGIPIWSITEEGRTEQAPVWALGSVVRREHPHRWGGMVELAPDADISLLPSVLGGDEDEVAIRGTAVFARRLRRAPLAGRPPSREWRPTGTVLVTGGTGALGSHVARWLAARGADEIVLLSRRGEADPALLAELGDRAVVVACDVSDRDGLAEALSGRPITAVFHTAAVLDDAVLDDLTVEQLDRALAVKAVAARNLHDLTRHLDLSAFVLFSSLTAVLADIGQGGYGPGNAYLDALARERRALGLPATSIGWGHWDGGGIGDGLVEQRLRRYGLGSMRPDDAIEALQQALDHDETHVLVVDADWTRFDDNGSLLRDLVPARAEDDPADALRRRLDGADADSARRVLLDLVCDHLAVILGHASGREIDETRAFRELGLDSVTAVELRNRLCAATGLRLPATVIFTHPSAHDLAAMLFDELAPAVEPVDELDVASLVRAVREDLGSHGGQS
ncbi:hypothetical protein Lesp02_01390 [Lentzea sp. NBRC 105346]|uniref:type I polyketide synthase n=1 Tax=Lentzea sp. NBRC 105346 TaxID=3032205 RepID=UPI0024A0DDA6|nr:type I polyketide synthase [Lentzea sp. NBRC 105346]GLZ27949.1 hypothetical protein Lesp02_01390 [Lentzea sp. NBRC 105346]